MTGAAAAGVGGWRARGEEPVGRSGGTASRRHSLGLILAAAVGAGGSGAVLGLLKQPDPRDQVDAFAFTATAAIEVARHAEDRAQSAEAALASAQARVRELSAFGAAQELADVQEAERLGVARFMRDSTAVWGREAHGSAGGRAEAEGWSMGERRTIMAAIVREARRNGLDPLLVAAVIQVESRFDPFAISGVGARGLMQLMPPTAQWLLRKDELPPSHLFNPVLNIELGTAYLGQLMDRFDGDMQQALIAYNAGPAVARSLKRGSPAWKRLRAYPKAVLAAYSELLTPPQQVAAR